MAQMTQVGALWEKTAKSGLQYMSGVIDKDKLPPGNKINLVVFANKNRKTERSPSHSVFLSEPKNPSGAPWGGNFNENKAGASDDDDSPF